MLNNSSAFLISEHNWHALFQNQPQAAVHQSSRSAALAAAAPLLVTATLLTGHLTSAHLTSLSTYR
ncbi:hypothetical protein E2C01_056178 [Portunus trituberculatus]|uniref:Uncharacterized protein n=1 Tax=Portunus trituberculatus TaxID=210409 RepID=A0A5B7GWW1_PORTR|nr:hypothetical protein [Portunus trituberculatus]